MKKKDVIIGNSYKYQGCPDWMMPKPMEIGVVIEKKKHQAIVTFPSREKIGACRTWVKYGDLKETN